MRSLIHAVLLLLTGCAYISKSDESARLDPDGDGVLVGEDCDDSDPDQGGPIRWLRDDDGDGFGNDDDRRRRCEQPEGFVSKPGDCDDRLAEVNPDAEEVCDGLDNDCDGELDNGLEQIRWYRDVDGDGFGDAEDSLTSCAAPDGYVDNGDDCDDTDVQLQDGGSPEVPYNGIDDNCDESDGDGDWDGDGYWALDYLDIIAAAGLEPMSIPVGFENDCNDEDDSIYPGAADPPYDGTDSDCRGDDDCDIDGDGFGALAGECTPTLPDCNDADPAVNPDATETCATPFDDDCNGSADGLDLVGCTTFFRDVDGDSWGTESTTVCRCLLPDFFAELPGDCDDADDTVNPGALDIPYDGVDSDCSGGGDCDVDGDGYDAFVGSCTPDVVDCDDSDPLVSPGEVETCDTIDVDDDCNGETNEEDALGCTDHFFDFDGDGFGTDDTRSCLCEPASLFIVEGGDCADADVTVFPGADEECDLIDTDCDGSLVDEFTDLDGDGQPDCVDPPDLGFEHGATWLFTGLEGSGTGRSVTVFQARLVIGAPGTPELGSRAYVMSLPPMGHYDLERDALLIEHDGGTGLGRAVLGFVDEAGLGWLALGMSKDSGVALLPMPDESVDLHEDEEASLQVFSLDTSVECGTSLRQGPALGFGLTGLLIGCPRSAPGPFLIEVESLVLSGASTSLDALADQLGAGIDGVEVTDRGLAIGDVDGDGIADVMVAAPKADQKGDNAGAMALYMGPITGDLGFAARDGAVYGDAADALLGGAVDVGQDWNGDGVNDIVLLAGSAAFTPSSIGDGAAHFISADDVLSAGVGGDFRGSDGFASLVDEADHWWDSPTLISLDSASDEERPRLIIGLPGDDLLAINAGLFYALNGPVGTGVFDIDAETKVFTGEAGEALGSALHIADLDGDGIDEVLVGAMGRDVVYGFVALTLFDPSL